MARAGPFVFVLLSAAAASPATAVGAPSDALDTFTFMQTGTMQEAELVHGWTTSFGPPVPSESAAGPKGSPVFWEGLSLIKTVYEKYKVPGSV